MKSYRNKNGSQMCFQMCLNLVNGFDIRAGRGWLQWLRLNLTGWLLCSGHRLGGIVLYSLVLGKKPSPIPAELKRKTQRLFLFCGDEYTHLPWHLKRWEFGQGGSVWEGCLSVIIQVKMKCLSSGFDLQQQKLFLFGKRSGFSLHS